MTTAQDIMSAEPVTVPPTATARDVAELLREHRIGAVPVVDDRRGLIGIVTDRDLVVDVLANGGGPDDTIETFGVRTVVTITPDASVEDVRRVLGERQLHRLPVVRDGELLGIISLADVATRTQDTAAVGFVTERISA